MPDEDRYGTVSKSLISFDAFLTREPDIKTSGARAARTIEKSIAVVTGSTYLSRVKGKMKHTILGILIAGYLSVSLVGHLDVLRSLINTGGESHQVTSAKKSRPIGSGPYWTQRKHLPSSTKKAEGASETVLSTAQAPNDQNLAVIRISAIAFLPAQLVYPPHRPRDPPSA